jgi:hypothetical protein
MGDLRNEAKSCALAGDVSNSAKFSRVAASLAPLLFRLERARSTDDGSVVFPASELVAKTAELAETLRALVGDGAFVCSRCGRAERVSWAEDLDDSAPLPAPAPRANERAPRAPEPEEDDALTKYRAMMQGKR